MKVNELKTVHLTIMPKVEDMEHGVIYVSMKFNLAIHLCACGECRWQTVTPFVLETASMNHFWQYTENEGRVTLHPSIGNHQFPCKSHYWVRDGKIVWD